MNNIVKPVPCKILEVKKESKLEYTFKVETDIKPAHGQFYSSPFPRSVRLPSRSALMATAGLILLFVL